jgi:hypothetical protein
VPRVTKRFRELTRKLGGRIMLLIDRGNQCPMSRAGATQDKANALPALALANPTEDASAGYRAFPKANRTAAFLPANAYSERNPYECMHSCTPVKNPAPMITGLTRVNLPETASLRVTRGSQGPSSSTAYLHTGHWSGWPLRSRSVTQLWAQSWWAVKVQGQASTQESGGSEGSSSQRQMKHRRGASVAVEVRLVAKAARASEDSGEVVAMLLGGMLFFFLICSIVC